MMKKYINGEYVEMSAEETAEVLAEQRKFEITEKSRPLTESEVIHMLITQQVNTLEVDDNTALRMVEFYPTWEVGTAYTAENKKPVGYKVRYGDKLWKLKQEHTSQVGWEPENTASLWEQTNEAHSGTKDDPIPYDGNMALVSGLYYIQDYVIYLCIRDTVSPVYNALNELVNIYVEEIK